jgi:hypothetical protein
MYFILFWMACDNFWRGSLYNTGPQKYASAGMDVFIPGLQCFMFSLVLCVDAGFMLTIPRFVCDAV